MAVVDELQDLVAEGADIRHCVWLNWAIRYSVARQSRNGFAQMWWLRRLLKARGPLKRRPTSPPARRLHLRPGNFGRDSCSFTRQRQRIHRSTCAVRIHNHTPQILRPPAFSQSVMADFSVLAMASTGHVRG